MNNTADENKELTYILQNIPIAELQEHLKSGLSVKQIAEAIQSINGRKESLTEQPKNLDRFHITNDSGKITGAFDYEIFKYIIENENIFVMGDTPYIYKNGVYKPDYNGSQLKTMIRKLIYPKYIKSNTIRRIYDLFLQASELQVRYEELNQQPPYYINFLNGFYDALNDKFIEHSPKYKAINQVPHIYNPDERCSGDNIEEWFGQLFHSLDERKMILQYAGLCLTTDTRQQKFLLITGDGGTGKSQLIRLFDSAVGSENISNVPLEELNQRFASFGVMGKLMNSCADLKITVLDDISMLKKLLGEDTIRAEQKGKDAVFFKNYSKLLFSINGLPTVINERSNALYRRLLIFEMSKPPENISIDFFDKINSEIDYFIQISVQALHEMYSEHNGIITEAQSSKEQIKHFQEDNDTVEAFLNAETSKIQSGRIDRVVLYSKYEEYCSENERQSLSKTNFYKALRTKGYSEISSCGTNFFKGLIFNKDILTTDNPPF